MTDEMREAKRAYEREWARKNPEKVKARRERFWAKKAAQLAAAEGQQGEQAAEGGGNDE